MSLYTQWFSNIYMWYTFHVTQYAGLHMYLDLFFRMLRVVCNLALCVTHADGLLGSRSLSGLKSVSRGLGSRPVAQWAPCPQTCLRIEPGMTEIVSTWQCRAESGTTDLHELNHHSREETVLRWLKEPKSSFLNTVELCLYYPGKYPLV